MTHDEELTRTGLESIQSEGSTLIRYRPGAVTILSGGKEVTLQISADALAVLLDDVARAASAGR